MNKNASNCQILASLDRNPWPNWVFQSWNATREKTASRIPIHRIISQTAYSFELLASRGADTAPVESIAGKVLDEIYGDSYISTNNVAKYEQELAEAIEQYNDLQLLFVGHSHLDINWQWGWDETASIASETISTVLRLMERYPDVVFSQSQAIIYDIIARYRPDLIHEIQKRIDEGRWELLVSGWVEGDKNLVSTENICRQIELGKQTVKDLFGYPPELLRTAFEPDTFGHSAMLPELLSRYGIKYYYCCRGTEDDVLFSWLAPSGSRLTVYRDPKFYTMGATGDFARLIPPFAEKHRLRKIPALYGMSDHGGGITVKDIERITEMQQWPAFPKVSFSRLESFFEHAASLQETLPSKKEEINFVFTGCYASGGRIKQGHFQGTRQLYHAEAAESVIQISAAQQIQNNTAPGFTEAWKKLLTTEFHDIITGVGVEQTAGHALASFQEVGAAANTAAKHALEETSRLIDTSSIKRIEEHIYDTATGAGAGYGSFEGTISQTSNDFGSVRVFHIWNLLPYARKSAVNIALWNYEQDINALGCSTMCGRPVRFQQTDADIEIFDGLFTHPQATYYWGHWYALFLAEVELPAFGYETIYLYHDISKYQQLNSLMNPDSVTKVYSPERVFLENPICSITFDPADMSVVSFYDKITEREHLDPARHSGFYLFYDDNDRRMDAWEYGRCMGQELLAGTITSVKKTSGDVYQKLSFSLSFSSSTADISFMLINDTCDLHCEAAISWKEFGTPATKNTNLSFMLFTSEENTRFAYDIPGGVISRTALDHSVPAVSFAASEESGIMIASKGIHGFFGKHDMMGIVLVRNSMDPNPFNEIGSHRKQFMVSLIPDDSSSGSLHRKAEDYTNDPLVISGKVQSPGSLPGSYSFITIQAAPEAMDSNKLPDSSVTMTSIRTIPGDKGIRIRLVELDGNTAQVHLTVHPGMKIEQVLPAVTSEDITSETQPISAEIINPQTAAVTLQPYVCSELVLIMSCSSKE